jgi:hypothetical protein
MSETVLTTPILTDQVRVGRAMPPTGRSIATQGIETPSGIVTSSSSNASKP